MTPRLALRHGWLGLAIALACTPDPADEPEPGSTGLLPGSTSAASSTGAADSTSGVGSTTRADEGSTSNSTASDSSDGGVLFDLGGTPDAGPMPGMCAPEVPMIAAVPCDPADVVIVPPFDLHYDCLELPVIPDVPSSHGGVSFHHSDPDLLLIGGSANTAAGELYSIRITRDADCHVTGLADAQAQVYSEAAYNDGGVDYGPDDVLFLARWPVNELGQLLPGSTVTDRIDLLAPLGVGPSSIAGLTFVPATYPGEGQLKVITWSGGEWFTLPYSAAGDGTFDIGDAIAGPVLPGGPEGIVYISGDNEGFDDVSVLVAEWTAGNVAAYLVDAQGDPIMGSRQDFIVGLEGAEGAHIDRTSGDFLFSTFGGGDRLIMISGFVPNPPPAG